MTDRVTVWGVGGYGDRGGGLLLTPEGAPALESGLSMKMAAAGTRGGPHRLYGAGGQVNAEVSYGCPWATASSGRPRITVAERAGRRSR